MTIQISKHTDCEQFIFKSHCCAFKIKYFSALTFSIIILYYIFNFLSIIFKISIIIAAQAHIMCLNVKY